MAVTTFVMNPRSAAPTSAGAALIPFVRRWAASWSDADDEHTYLHVEHPDEDTAMLVDRVMGADPEIRLVS